MTTKRIDKILFVQGGHCFFCQRRLAPADASVEHLVASANGGGNGEDNCVVCCKTLNTLLGRMSLKEKFRVVLNQRGAFVCPDGAGSEGVTASLPSEGVTHELPKEALRRAIADLRKRGDARPRTLKTLASTINNLFQKKLSPAELLTLIERLKAKRVVLINGTKVSYAIPTSDDSMDHQ